MKILIWAIIIFLIFRYFKNKKVENLPAIKEKKLEMASNSTSLTANDFTQGIPPRTRSLLYVSKEDPEDASFYRGISIKLNLFDGTVESEDIPATDPSTIFLKAPIAEPKKNQPIEGIGYYPTYLQLTPEQKWKYIQWLKDISKPIDIGYVFIYYYGLERHLILGDFDNAFEEIMLLKKFHKNNSFIGYSDRALFYSCIIKEEFDRLKDLKFLLEENTWENIHLLLAYKLELDLSVDQIISILRGVTGLNRRYIKNNLDVYKNTLKQVLIKKYNKSYLPLKEQYDYKKLPKREERIYANISFPYEFNTTKVPSIIDYKPFINELISIHEEAHEEVKNKLREMRKKSKNKS